LLNKNVFYAVLNYSKDAYTAIMKMNCNECGACCIAPSISSYIPGMKVGKPAGVRCNHLTHDMKCGIYSKRPDVCRNFTPTTGLCGNNFNEAYHYLSQLEEMTKNI
jgi:Fe-S-cluster containining protein